jgi:hypothetical protein
MAMAITFIFIGLSPDYKIRKSGLRVLLNWDAAG